MLNTKIQNAINSQINAEIYSSYLYLAMSAYCAENGLSGFANWMKIQAQEELSHAQFFFDYVLEHGAHIELDAIEKPEVSWNSILEVFEKTLEHEKYVTSRINDLMTLSIEEKDHATASFLKWFIDEQVEEEATADDILSKLKLAKGEGSVVFFMDQEAAKRTFVMPVKN